MALQLLLESEPGMVITGFTDRAEGLQTLVGTLQPDVLLLDCELAKQPIVALIADLHQLAEPPAIIALAINPQVKEPVLAAGASAFISKDAPPDELLPILQRLRSSIATGEKP